MRYIIILCIRITLNGNERNSFLYFSCINTTITNLKGNALIMEYDCNKTLQQLASTDYFCRSFIIIFNFVCRFVVVRSFHYIIFHFFFLFNIIAEI